MNIFKRFALSIMAFLLITSALTAGNNSSSSLKQKEVPVDLENKLFKENINTTLKILTKKTLSKKITIEEINIVLEYATTAETINPLIFFILTQFVLAANKEINSVLAREINIFLKWHKKDYSLNEHETYRNKQALRLLQDIIYPLEKTYLEN